MQLSEQNLQTQLSLGIPIWYTYVKHMTEIIMLQIHIMFFDPLHDLMSGCACEVIY